jgi:hypothetical protein
LPVHKHAGCTKQDRQGKIEDRFSLKKMKEKKIIATDCEQKNANQP